MPYTNKVNTDGLNKPFSSRLRGLMEERKCTQKELGEANSKDDEIEQFKKKLNKLKCSTKVKEKIKREISRYEAANSHSPELGMIREYLDWMLNLPWHKFTKDNNNLNKVKDILDSSHYALDEVKERILEYLAVKVISLVTVIPLI